MNDDPSAGERRSAYRVSVRAGDPLHAVVLVDREELPVVAGNVSATGLFIRPTGRDLAGLAPGDWVDLRLDYEGESHLLTAVVRSARDGGFGLFVPRADHHGRLNPRTALGRIATRLQLRRLKARRI
jgi:hypothetical protein